MLEEENRRREVKKREEEKGEKWPMSRLGNEMNECRKE